jgi:hypothetical protein
MMSMSSGMTRPRVVFIVFYFQGRHAPYLGELVNGLDIYYRVAVPPRLLSNCKSMILANYIYKNVFLGYS